MVRWWVAQPGFRTWLESALAANRLPVYGVNWPEAEWPVWRKRW
jgi:hypothetical protein